MRTTDRWKMTSVCAPLAAVMVLSFAGCAHVTPNDLSLELTKVRQELRGEIQEGDRKVSEDLGGRMTRLEGSMAAVAEQLEQLRDTFAVTVERMDDAIRFEAPVYFGFDDASIRQDDRPVLDRFAAVLKSHYEDVLITVEGFADPSGSADYNRRLGMRRAEAVVDYLRSPGGIDVSHLRAVSYGEDPGRLLVPASGPGERALKNRRVVLVIEGQGDPELETATDATH